MLWIRILIRMFLGLPDPHPDPDPYVFGPPRSASGSGSHKYDSGSGSFHHQAKILRKTSSIVTYLWLFTSVPDPYAFGPPGSASGSVRQRYRSEEPDPDPPQNVADPQHCWCLQKTIFIRRTNCTILSECGLTGCSWGRWRIPSSSLACRLSLRRPGRPYPRRNLWVQ